MSVSNKDKIKNYIKESSVAISAVEEISAEVEKAAIKIEEVLKAGGKVLTMGCGGSAADSLHISSELLCRFRKNRGPLAAIDLTSNSSYVTAVSNDYDFSEVFSRQIDALATEKDAVIVISTSGNSESALKAADMAKEKGATLIVMTGTPGGKLAGKADILLRAPSSITSHIQECHQVIFHMICLIVEDSVFPDA